MFKFNQRNLIYSVVVILAIFILASFTPVVRPLTLGILKFPLLLSRLVGQEASGLFFYHRNLVLSDSLKKQCGLLQQRLGGANEAYLENKRFKELLDLKQKLSYKTAAARVIARSPDNWLSIILLDKGHVNGIKRGGVAITPAGLAGRVIETTPHVSKVVLINDPDFGVSAIVQRSRQEGLVSGTLGSSLVMRYLPKESDVKVGDLILTSGLTVRYPKGLAIGTVIDVGEEFSGLSRYAVIKPAVNLSNIEEVLIISQ